MLHYHFLLRQLPQQEGAVTRSPHNGSNSCCKPKRKVLLGAVQYSFFRELEEVLGSSGAGTRTPCEVSSDQTKRTPVLVNLEVGPLPTNGRDHPGRLLATSSWMQRPFRGLSRDCRIPIIILRLRVAVELKCPFWRLHARCRTIFGL